MRKVAVAAARLAVRTSGRASLQLGSAQLPALLRARQDPGALLPRLSQAEACAPVRRGRYRSTADG